MADVPDESSPVHVCACPSCSTRLRVSDDQLAIADGQVRCGACLAVFDASANLVTPQQPPEPTVAQPMPAESDTPAEELAEDAHAAPAIEPAPTTEEALATAAVDDDPPVEAEPPAPVLGPRQIAPRAARRSRSSRRRKSSDQHLNYGGPAAANAAVALFLLLVVNVLGLQFDSWSQLQATRGIYAQACKLVGCDLPPLRSLMHVGFESQSGDGRLGPPEQLTLAATLVNRARFRQRFPTVAVQLLDVKGNAIARHRIPPAEYLEAGTPRSMTPNRPKSIALRLDDPGVEAVRYAIALE